MGVTAAALLIRVQIGCVLIAELPVFLQRLVDDLFQFRRQFGIHAPGSSRRTIQNSFDNHAGGIGTERLSAGGHLIQHGSETEEVRACVQLFATNLLRRHIVERAHGGARRGDKFI
jgi:hypothetical protein